MDNNIYDTEKQLEKYIKNNADGQILVLSSELKLFYLKTIVNSQYISENIKKFYFESIINFEQYIYSISEPNLTTDIDSILFKLMEGYVIALYKGKFFAIPEASKRENRGLYELTTEASFEGGTESFVEETNLNLNLVRKYYRNSNLVVSSYTVGTLANSKLSILYDSKLVNQDILKTLVERVENIDIPVIQSLNELQQILWQHQLLIPKLMVTQRPDRAIKNLTLGKILLFLDGTPTVLILPVCFHDFLTTVDDTYLLPIPASFIIALRYFGLILSLILPAAYVAVTAYNPEIVKVQLALSITSSRNGVPYPAFIEVGIMLLLMEFLVEASLRLPKSIGQAATTVGGLILGQAAIQANLVSNIMIMIIATVAISNFTIPVTSMNLTVRVSKYIMLILACFAGTAGIYMGFFYMSLYIFSIKTFNTEYFNPIDKLSFKKLKSFINKGDKS
ncbi:spore germination protein [Clostridium sp. YIM B02505]|uniref:Spore germination protein n=1 Tax=Clostridium yunnanense TaxID=2800325 RepID=A0ABS1EUT3_9CLOT|nr:spore germination protein [Clostridium yunnanense]MBK1813048.1 spore germination protein [Clostridium yunnanense]